MTEKRSEYRKKETQQKRKKFFSNFKSAFNDRENSQEVDDDQGLSERRPLHDDPEFEANFNPEFKKLDKAKSLKRKLNTAILIVSVLIVLVLLALFHL